MTTCKVPVYLIAGHEDLISRFSLSKLFFNELNQGCMRSNVHLTKTLESAVNHAKNNYTSWILCISPGHVFLSDFWIKFDNFMAQNPDVGIVGHIMSNRDEPLLHKQAIAINLSAVTHSEILPGFVLSQVKNSRNYAEELFWSTQFFIDSLCQHVLSNNFRVINWDEHLRNYKVNWYTKEHDQLQNQLLRLTLEDDVDDRKNKIVSSTIQAQTRNKKILWVVNNKTPDTIDTEHLICPASGLFWLEQPAQQVTVFDYNPVQLDFVRDLWTHRPADLSQWIQNWAKQHDCMPNFLHSDSLDQLSSYVSTKKFCWDKQVDFLHIDLFESYSRFENFRGATIWLSNIGCYEPNILNHGIQKIKDIKMHLSSYGLNVLDDYNNSNHGWI